MGTVKTFIGNIKGKQGNSPYVGENDNWWVGNTDTGVKARGKSAYQYAVDGGYAGTEAEFAAKLNAELVETYTKSEADEKFLTEESDPTVPGWAKEASKPTYTAAEVGADEQGAAAAALDEAKKYTNDEIAELINGAPTTLDTLGEIATAMADNADVVTALNNAIGSKADATAVAELERDINNKAATALENANRYTDDKIEQLTHVVDDKASKSAVETVMDAVDRKAERTTVETLAREVENKAAAADLTAHTGNKNNPHGVTAAQLGLKTESFTFTLEDGSTVTKAVYVG